jgi:hypothetical protein
MGDKKRKNKKQRRKNVEGSSKKGKLPSSVQALLGYLGGGGPTPMYQQPVNVQRERAGVDSVETLSQIIRQQNLMNASYMQNMERLAFKNEIQDQLKKQGEEQKKEIKEAREEQKQEISKVVVQTQEAIQETTQKSLQQQRTSLMRKIAYERKKVNPKPEKIQSLEDQLEVIESSIRGSKLSELRSSLLDTKLTQRTSIPTTPYVPPLGTNDSSSVNYTPVATSSPNLFEYGLVSKSNFPSYAPTPIVQVGSAAMDNIVQTLPPLDRNINLDQQLLSFQTQMSPALKTLFAATQQGQRNINSSKELLQNMKSFQSTDAYSSSGTSSGKFASSLKKTP